MRKLYAYGLSLAAILAPHLVGAQTLTVDATYTPQELIEDVLIGQGVQVSNVQFSGNGAARGYFDGSNSNIGLQAGVVISTGRAIDAEGPNGTPFSDLGTEFNGPGDPELTAISGSPLGTFDAAILEFDFVPSNDTVQFRYVFASNEYMLYVGTGVNDVFGFLISGPGIVGEQNVALIPGTADAVTIDNVNANTNAQYYIDNENPPGNSVEFNGFTSVFTAQAILTECETYHIRLAIADGGDWSFDSAVFLEAGSFTSPSVSVVGESTFSTSATEHQLVEGCSSMTLTFERSAPYDDPLNIGLNFTGTGTVGADVTSIPNTISFPAGTGVVDVTFDVLADGNAEGDETITITLDQLNPCVNGPASSVTFTIQDPIPLTLQTSPDTSFLCPQDYTINVTPSGGYPNYSYQWSIPNETGSTVTVNSTTTQTYTVTVTDECGLTANGSVTVDAGGYTPIVLVVEDEVVCNGDTTILIAWAVGGVGGLTYSWDGNGTDTSYAIAPTSDITVNLSVSDSCGVTVEEDVFVLVDETEASFTSELVAHNAYQFTSNAEGAVEYFWEFGDDSTGTAPNPRHVYIEPGVYQVSMTVTNENGCVTTEYAEVTAYAPLTVYIPNSFTPNDDGLNDTWGIVGDGYLYYDLEIYNKWGERLLEGRFTDEVAWDGTFKGQKVLADAYVYRVFVQPPLGIEFRESGVLFMLSGE